MEKTIRPQLPQHIAQVKCSTSSIICSTSDSGPDSDQIEDNREIHITDLEAESNIKSTHSSCLQTSLASAIAKALGHNREITEFDKLRHQLKEAKKHKKQLPGYKQLTDQHEKFLTLFGTRLLKHRSKLASAEYSTIRTRLFLLTWMPTKC